MDPNQHPEVMHSSCCNVMWRKQESSTAPWCFTFSSLTTQMTPMTYASRFTGIKHRISMFPQLDRQMTDEGSTDGSRGDSRPS